MNRAKYKALLEKISDILDSGKSLSIGKFEEILTAGNKLLKSFLIIATTTSTSFIVGALYKNIFENERILPFKARWVVDLHAAELLKKFKYFSAFFSTFTRLLNSK